MALLDAAPDSIGIDLAALRRYRLARVREQMVEYDVDALVLSFAR